MAPSRFTFAAALAFAMTFVDASPISGKIDTAMPFLSAATESASSATVWWTPEASQSQWDWKTWSQTAAQSTPSATVAAVQTSSAPYSNPFTIYTTMTNSMGVITGMPAVVTSQPSQAPKATECSGCASVLSGEASWSSMVASIYSTATPVANAANATSSGASESASASATRPGFSQSTGAASRNDILNSSVMIAVFGAAAYLL